jgi:hypothetical protein
MKKLLLILLCLPMIGFGQSDKIIFSSGDTIYGKVIEVGVNDITYQHKDETTNNVTKKRELAKVIYSSGRIETFQGLGILESKITKEESEKLYIQQKEERNEIRIQKREDRKRLGIQNYWTFKIGTAFLIPFVKEESLLGINIEALYNHQINKKISIVNSLAYYSLGFQIVSITSAASNYYPFRPEKVSYKYLSLSVMGSYAINNKFSVMSGISFDQSLIYIIDSEYAFQSSTSFVSLVVSTKYSIFKQFFIYSDIKLPLIHIMEGYPILQLEYNRYLSLGIGIDL